jgi:3-hydroxyisobutyrate dehydrogenase-like beta-hydroxyacid dehydrogenase
MVISIVPGGQNVKKAYFDKKTGVIAAKKDEQRLSLGCSTIDIEATKDAGRRLKEEGSGT